MTVEHLKSLTMVSENQYLGRAECRDPLKCPGLLLVGKWFDSWDLFALLTPRQRPKGRKSSAQTPNSFALRCRDVWVMGSLLRTRCASLRIGESGICIIMVWERVPSWPTRTCHIQRSRYFDVPSEPLGKACHDPDRQTPIYHHRGSPALISLMLFKNCDAPRPSSPAYFLSLLGQVTLPP